MLKNISNLGKTLTKTDQESINGGNLPVKGCNSPYFVSDGICNPGDYNHPIYGHCICCAG